MNIQYETKKNTLIVKLSGELDHHEAEKIRTDLDDMIIKTRVKNIIFDLDSMKFMDSSGIGMIIGRYKNVVHHGGKVAVVGVREKIDKIFALAGLYKIIKKYEDTKDAINHMQRSV